MSKILLCLSDENTATAAAEALAATKHSVSQIPSLSPDDGLPKVAETILEHKSDVVVMDYWPEDAAGIKLMQIVTEQSVRPEFIFIEMPTSPAEREQVMMALNEGACAFLPLNFRPAALVNYVERAAAGPGRLRSKILEHYCQDLEAQRLEEQLGELRSRAHSFQKLIAYLLTAPAAAQQRKTLVVSDSPYQLEMLKKILDDYNIPSLTASNPTDGLKIAVSERPRIIVSDLELEGQTGIEFCQAVKFTNKIVPCHFIICTANQDKIAKVMTPGNGVDDCLLKPSGQSDTVDFISRAALGFLL
ncbi:MAG: response regulator [Candidatus Adiutrix sp.]|jgi:DNA-binding response OmpR family regulator|nr:response regulator [Candidatus Adiutrix sp.]